jgi:hypothetical protein
MGHGFNEEELERFKRDDEAEMRLAMVMANYWANQTWWDRHQDTVMTLLLITGALLGLGMFLYLIGLYVGVW